MILITKQSQTRLLSPTHATVISQILGILFMQRISFRPVDAIDQTTVKNSLEINQKLVKENVMFNEISSSRNRCAAAEANLDKCSAQLIALGQSDVLYPYSKEELDSIYCPNFKNLVSCVKNSTECYKPFERQIINWVLSSSRRMNYKRCKNDSEKQKFLRLTQSCFTLMRNPMDKCMYNYIASLEAIARSDDLGSSEDDIQIQLSCCANRRFKDCVMQNAKQNCKPVESLRKLRRTNSVSSQRVAQKHFERSALGMMEDLKSTLDSIALTGPEFICESVDEKFCLSKYDVKYRGGTARHKSIVPAMIKIYSK